MSLCIVVSTTEVVYYVPNAPCAFNIGGREDRLVVFVVAPCVEAIRSTSVRTESKWTHAVSETIPNWAIYLKDVKPERTRCGEHGRAFSEDLGVAHRLAH